MLAIVNVMVSILLGIRPADFLTLTASSKAISTAIARMKLHPLSKHDRSLV
jgi:hypothetical protein